MKHFFLFLYYVTQITVLVTNLDPLGNFVEARQFDQSQDMGVNLIEISLPWSCNATQMKGPVPGSRT